jgi:hypothetical protein
VIRDLLKPSGYSIHCIDYVLSGNGAEEHSTKLRIIANEHDILPMLDTTINKLSDDVETYFLSDEGHYFWKGQKRYDEFPFRRVVSINMIKKCRRQGSVEIRIFITKSFTPLIWSIFPEASTLNFSVSKKIERLYAIDGSG